MAGMNWSRRFDDPIPLPDGRKLRTLKDAAEYVLALPPELQAEPAWQQAAQDLKNAADGVDVVRAVGDDARAAWAG
jgi:hypothetical protein